MPNGHIVAIGASGSGKTQTLKAIADELRQTYPDIQVVVYFSSGLLPGVIERLHLDYYTIPSELWTLFS